MHQLQKGDCMEKNSYYGSNFVSASYIGNPISNTVMFLSKKVEYLLSNLDKCNNCLVFCEDTILVPDTLMQKHTFVRTPNPQYEYAKYVKQIAQDIELNRQNKKHKLTDEGYYIGENVFIGNNSIIEPLCLIDHDVIIGENARILSGSKIRNAVIGDNFLANENAVIGSYAYTLSKNEDNKLVRIPALGKLIIGDNVEIGTHCNISVGSAGNTIINDYVKIDSFVYIGHDDIIKENVEITSGVIIGGYNIIENNSYVGMNSTLRNRITIGENSIIGMGSVVTKSINAKTTVVGNPAHIFNK